MAETKNTHTNIHTKTIYDHSYAYNQQYTPTFIHMYVYEQGLDFIKETTQFPNVMQSMTFLLPSSHSSMYVWV